MAAQRGRTAQPGRRLVVEADGGSRGNPGVAGYGALVRDPETGAVLAERAAPLGKASNNVAEYTGLIEGLLAAQLVDPGAVIEARMDSKLVVEQMSGRWKIKHEDMRRLALQARDVCVEITEAGGSVSFTWIPRAENAAADTLSNVGMDGETVRRGPAAADALSDGPVEEAAADETASRTSKPTSGEASDEESAGAPRTGGQRADASAAGAQKPPREPRARVLLVRHGTTDFTSQGRLDGRGGPDPDLNEGGRRQAENAGRLAAHLCGPDTRVVTSSLARAKQTGAIVAEALGVTPQEDEDFDEQSFGDFDGESFRDLIRHRAQELRSLRVDPDFVPTGGESHAQMAQRVLRAYDRVVEAGGTTVVVCHRKPIMVVMSHLLGIPHELGWRLAAAPGSLTAIEVWEDGNVQVAFTNRT